jgi:hypothetical protein
MKVYWLPGKALENSLKVASDHDTNIIVSVLENFNNLVAYFDHEGNIACLD